MYKYRTPAFSLWQFLLLLCDLRGPVLARGLVCELRQPKVGRRIVVFGESYCVPCGCIVRHGGGVCCTSVIRIESASWLRRINLVRFRRRQVTVGLVEALLVHTRAALGIHIEVTCQHECPLFLASFEHGLPPARCKVDRVRGDGGEIARFGMVGAHVLAGGSAATFAAQARHQAAFPVLSRIDRSSADTVGFGGKQPYELRTREPPISIAITVVEDVFHHRFRQAQCRYAPFNERVILELPSDVSIKMVERLKRGDMLTLTELRKLHCRRSLGLLAHVALSPLGPRVL
mmetsp:Transcript_49146/g.139261  ORF Transcript_49146/g.139261 Transcript_49146/m.139261 type:complete len:289 (+) Transcript_49146:268-1134(+)